MLLKIAPLLFALGQMMSTGLGGAIISSGGGGGGGDMAIIRSGGATNDAAGTTLSSQSLNCTGANTIAVFAEDAGGSGPTGIVDSVDATAYVRETAGDAVQGGNLSVWYKKNATASSTLVVTATWASVSFRRIMVYCLSNGSTIDPTDGAQKTISTSASGTFTTTAITPSASGGVILSAMSNNDGVNCTFTANNSFSLDFGINGTINGTTTFDTDAMSLVGATGAQTPSVTMSATGGAVRMIAVGFKK